MGNSKGYRFNVNVQIEACQMYMSNPSMTKQEVCDQYGCHLTTLGKWLRIHGLKHGLNSQSWDEANHTELTEVKDD